MILSGTYLPCRCFVGFCVVVLACLKAFGAKRGDGLGRLTN